MIVSQRLGTHSFHIKERKKVMKKFLSLFLVASMMLMMTACGNITENAPAQSASTAAESAASTADTADAAATEAAQVEESADAIHFDISTTGPQGSLLGNVCDYFAEQVKTASNGEMIVDVYYSSALGSEAQNLEALTAGTLDMAIIAIEFYSNSIPELGAVILPFLYEDYDQVQTVLSGEAGKYASERLRDAAGVENLGYYVMMFRNMYMNKAINSVDDMAGVKIRVPESALYVNTMKMMGAAPTPMAFGEIYTSCETGVIDGFENTPDSCLNNSMFEVLDYMNMTRHLNAPTTISMSAKVFDGLTPEQQQILRDAGVAASEYGLKTTKEAEADFIQQLSEKMEIVETDVDSMRAKIDYSNYEFMAGEEAQKLFDLVKQATGK